MVDISNFIATSSRIKPLKDAVIAPLNIKCPQPISLKNPDGSYKERAKIVVLEYLGATNTEIRATVRKGGHWVGITTELGYGVQISNDTVTLISPLTVNANIVDGTDGELNVAIKDNGTTRRLKISEAIEVIKAIKADSGYSETLTAEKALNAFKLQKVSK